MCVGHGFQDLEVQGPLALLTPPGCIGAVEEVGCYVVCREGIGEAHGCCFALGRFKGKDLERVGGAGRSFADSGHKAGAGCCGAAGQLRGFGGHRVDGDGFVEFLHIVGAVVSVSYRKELLTAIDLFETVSVRLMEWSLRLAMCKANMSTGAGRQAAGVQCNARRSAVESRPEKRL